MGLIAKESGGGTKYPPVPAGLHIGICYGVLDLGTHHDEKFKKDIHKIILQWELPDVRIDIEKEGEPTRNLPRAISKQYTLSLHEKANLRKDLESWRGKSFTEEELEGFDLFMILGIPCQINIIHAKKDDKTYANISTVVPVKDPKRMDTENGPTFFSFEEWPEKPIPEDAPDWIKDIIVKAKEYNVTLEDEPVADSPAGGFNEAVGNIVEGEEDGVIPF